MAAKGRTPIDRIGQRFGLVVVLERAGDDGDGYPVWRVRCDCGVERITRVDGYGKRAPTTHIACSKAKWAAREAVLRQERKRAG